MGGLFNDGFTSYNLGYRGLLVDCLINRIFRVCIIGGDYIGFNNLRRCWNN